MLVTILTVKPFAPESATSDIPVTGTRANTITARTIFLHIDFSSGAVYLARRNKYRLVSKEDNWAFSPAGIYWSPQITGSRSRALTAILGLEDSAVIFSRVATRLTRALET